LLNLYSCGVLLTDSGFSGEIRRDKVGREEAFAAPRHALPPVHITGSNKHTDTPLKAILAMASHYTGTRAHARTHTHTFNGPFSRTTQVCRYQKGKTKLDFAEARDSEWQWHQLGHMMQVCTLFQTDNNTSTSVFYRPDALPAA